MKRYSLYLIIIGFIALVLPVYEMHLVLFRIIPIGHPLVGLLIFAAGIWLYFTSPGPGRRLDPSKKNQFIVLISSLILSIILRFGLYTSTIEDLFASSTSWLTINGGHILLVNFGILKLINDLLIGQIIFGLMNYFKKYINIRTLAVFIIVTAFLTSILDFILFSVEFNSFKSLTRVSEYFWLFNSPLLPSDFIFMAQIVVLSGIAYWLIFHFQQPDPDLELEPSAVLDQ